MLEEAFASPELESFSQRLTARCYLPPFGREETAQFIRAQLAATGADPDAIFEGDAADAVFEATDGVPRLVNQLCDRAMWFAASEDHPRVSRDIVQKAWGDLQQLPTPWETRSSEMAEAVVPQVVEFGSLDIDIRDAIDHVEEETANIEPTDLDFDEDLELAVRMSQANETPVSSGFKTLPLPQGDGRGEGELPKDKAPSPRHGESPVATCPLPRGEGFESDFGHSNPSDPFAEKFAEEEVVLDCFAAWDNVFRRDTPRVQNRRDPGFTSLVQAVLATVEPAPAVAEVDEDIADDDTLLDPPSFTLTSGRPQLRLADVPEAMQMELIQSTSSLTDWSADSVTGTLSPPSSAIEPAVEALHDESSILVIESDSAPPPTPPVRREEYRNLFSRLRSG